MRRYYGKVVDVLSAEIRLPAEALRAAATGLFNQNCILCVYGHEERRCPEMTSNDTRGDSLLSIHNDAGPTIDGLSVD